MRKKIVAGNWKMNPLPAQAAVLLESLVLLKSKSVSSEVLLVVCPPTLYIQSALRHLVGSDGIAVGAQNCYFEKSGAYTGEVSAAMLSALNVPYCIVGHSERRAIFGESDQWVNLKTKALLSEGVSPIVCCGELLEERESDKQFEVVAAQLKGALKDLTAFEMKQVIIAYEPVWAIGTGKTASSIQAQEMHAFIRNELSSVFGVQSARETSILYGGSCKPDNARELFACADVDGGLIGGASLNAADFMAIANSF
jgi:triosephosphate isomerase (TIM)